MSLVRTPNMLYNAKMKRTDSHQVLGEVEEVVAGASSRVVSPLIRLRVVQLIRRQLVR